MLLTFVKKKIKMKTKPNRRIKARQLQKICTIIILQSSTSSIGHKLRSVKIRIKRNVFTLSES